MGETFWHEAENVDFSAGADDRWQQHFNNAAERLFGKTAGDILTAGEDLACIADADARMQDET